MSTDSVASTRQAAVRVVTGHYGSGKTEVSVSLAMRLAGLGHKVALADLDIVNPYFRSREQADLMTAAGIEVISSTLGHTVTLDLPAVSPKVHVPLADPTCDVILDAGGNEVGVKRAIEATSGFAVTGLISNTHVCRETTADDVAAGYRLTHDVSAATGIPISFVCGVPAALDGLQDRLGEPDLGELLPIGLYLRDAWM